MLDLSPDKILVLAVLALVVLGPHRLPQAARTLGRFMAQMRAFTSSMQGELQNALHDPDQPVGSVGAAITELRPGGIRRQVRQTVTDTLIGPVREATVEPVREVSSSTATAGREVTAPRTRRDLSAPARTPEDPSFN